jgi:hypothetical protein
MASDWPDDQLEHAVASEEEAVFQRGLYQGARVALVVRVLEEKRCPFQT